MDEKTQKQMQKDLERHFGESGEKMLKDGRINHVVNYMGGWFDCYNYLKEQGKLK